MTVWWKQVFLILQLLNKYTSLLGLDNPAKISPVCSNNFNVYTNKTRGNTSAWTMHRLVLYSAIKLQTNSHTGFPSEQNSNWTGTAILIFLRLWKLLGSPWLYHKHVKCPIYIDLHLCAALWFKIYYAR